MVSNSQQRSIFPDLPRDLQVVDKNGALTQHWKNFFDNLSLAFQTNLSPEGFRMPQQPDDNVSLLTAQESEGSVLYNSTTNLFEGNCQNPANLTDILPTPENQFFPFAMILNFAGDPNGAFPGTALQGLQNFFCWDTKDNQLYICTTSGNSSSAVWTLV